MGFDPLHSQHQWTLGGHLGEMEAAVPRSLRLCAELRMGLGEGHGLESLRSLDRSRVQLQSQIGEPDAWGTGPPKGWGVEWDMPGQASGDKEGGSTPGAGQPEPARPDSKRSRGSDWWPGSFAPPLLSHLPGSWERGLE